VQQNAEIGLHADNIYYFPAVLFQKFGTFSFFCRSVFLLFVCSYI